MKRIITLCLALCMVLGSFSQAHAIEVQASGQMDFIFGFTDNASMEKDNDEVDHFFARQRARVAFEFIANENLKGVLQMQYGTMNWGREGAQLDANTRNATIRRAYVDWNVGGTGLNLKVGIQHLALPSFTFGNPVFGANVAGVVASGCVTENVTLIGFWARPFNDDWGGAWTKNNETDLFGAAAIMDFDTFKIAPWLVYGSVGTMSGFYQYNNVGFFAEDGTGDLIVGGVAFEIFPVDALGIHVDAMYGYLDTDGKFVAGGDTIESSGWMVNALVDYKMGWGTPGVLAWYASGDDDGDVAKGEYGRLPVMGIDDGFVPTRLAFPGAVSAGDDTFISASGVGTWGAGVQIADLTFIERLSHTARIVYIQGTNDKKLAHGGSDFMGESLYLTTKDSLVEFGFDTEYKVQENLALYLELGYLLVDYSKATRAKDEDLFNAQFTLRYSF